MKNDNPEVSARQKKRQAQDSVMSGGWSGNNNGHEADKRSRVRNGAKAEASGEPTVSIRKVESNRRNSQKSTGPKTATGKKRVSRNAVRHGFFSKFLLIQHRDGKESQDEYDDFYAGIRKHYQPVGWLEELWVEKIAVWSWRLRRLIRCESGQIDRALAGHSYELQQSKADDLAEPESAPSSNPEMDAMTDHLFLPENEELDKLLRYEAMINRQLNHAIAELERVQARRKGEVNPSSSRILRNKAKKLFSFNKINISLGRTKPKWRQALMGARRGRDRGGIVLPRDPRVCTFSARLSLPPHLADPSGEAGLKPGSVQAIARSATNLHRPRYPLIHSLIPLTYPPIESRISHA